MNFEIRSSHIGAACAWHTSNAKQNILTADTFFELDAGDIHGGIPV
jgi:hypothetical protein